MSFSSWSWVVTKAMEMILELLESKHKHYWHQWVKQMTQLPQVGHVSKGHETQSAASSAHRLSVSLCFMCFCWLTPFTFTGLLMQSTTKMHHPQLLPSLHHYSWWNNTCKHCEYPWFIHKCFCWRSRPRKQDEVSKNILLGAFYGCTKDDHSCSWDAEITAINSGNTVVHHQPTLINSLTYWLFPMLPLTPSKVLTSSASTGIWYRAYPLGAIT